MNTNQQFAISCHILAVLGAHPKMTVTSEAIAESVNTNPAFIRRIMSHLRQHGLVESRPGNSGGWRLVRPASQMSLRDVYHAVSHESVLAMHQHPNPECPIGSNIQYALGGVFQSAQLGLEQALDKFSVESVLDSLREKQEFGKV